MAVLDRPRLRTEAAVREHAEARLSWRLLAVAIAGVGLAALLPVLQTSSATERGDVIRQMEQQRVELRAALDRLEARVAVLASTDRVRREALGRLGMVPAKSTLYVPLEGTAPTLRIPERLLPLHTEDASADDDPWWRRFADMLPRP